jgi:hypothetical protein
MQSRSGAENEKERQDADGALPGKSLENIS